ncbi:MAG: P1 family peptidase [Chloroflexota bacterium]
MYNAITDVPGLKVGHYTDLGAATGCTVLLCEDGAYAGVDVRGGAPATRETDLLDPTRTVQQVHAILLGGGSAFGLDAASGVMRFLEERGHGFDTGVAKVPIVPAACLYDLNVGSAVVRPDAEAGYKACLAAQSGPVAEGSVGVGTGARVGNLFGPRYATKGGVGTASERIAKNIFVGVLVVINAFGDIVDPSTNTIVAGTRKPVLGGFANTSAQLRGEIGRRAVSFVAANPTNTTLAVVATNAYLSKTRCTKVAQEAHDGLARSIRPVHTDVDGDLIFALSTGNPGSHEVPDSIVGVVAAELLAEAVVRAARQATSLAGVPAARDL